MTRVEFDDLVRAVEARYAGRQAALERRIALWVVLGLMGIVFWLLILVALGLFLLLLGAMQAAPLSLIMIAAGTCLTLYGLCQTVYMLRIEPVRREGKLLTPREAPALRGALADIQHALQCPPFDDVRITLDFNAAVQQVPRLGLLGWPRTYLEIGLPLAQAMSAAELRAVLAHECAHRSARHGRSGGRLYLLNQTWANLFQEMQKPAPGTFSRLNRWALNTFLGWYWPRVHARALVLSRMHEYQADNLAAEVAGRAALAGALWRMECLAPWLMDRFWPELHERARAQAEPPGDIARVLADACRTGPPAAYLQASIERGLGRATHPDETHPAFLDRVKPLGWTTEEVRRLGFPAAPSISAAQAFLDADLAVIEEALSRRWRDRVFASWRDRHRLAEAEKRTTAAPAGTDAALQVHLLWDTAQETARRQGLTAAEPLLRQVLERVPAHAGAGALLGRHLVGLGDPAGELMLTRVLESGDEIWLARAGEALEEHYRRTGQQKRLRAMRARLDQHELDCRAAQRERTTIKSRDPLIPHDLDDKMLTTLRSMLGSFAEADAAWLARKELRYFPERRLFILGVAVVSAGWWCASEREESLARQVASKVQLPGQVLVIARRGSYRRLARRIMSLPDAQVFRRGDAP